MTTRICPHTLTWRKRSPLAQAKRRRDNNAPRAPKFRTICAALCGGRAHVHIEEKAGDFAPE